MYHENSKQVMDNKSKGRMVGKFELFQKFGAVAKPLWEGADASFPVKVTRSWVERMSSLDGPLGKQATPHSMELVLQDDDLPDPVGEKLVSPVPFVVRKHRDRALFKVTKRCHLHCRYCFRRDQTDGDPTPREVDVAIEYLLNSDLNEVILSGGDPLSLSDEEIMVILRRLESLPMKRIHTRAPVTAPFRITDALVAELASVSGLWVVIHCNHSSELSEPVRIAIQKIINVGIPVLNQSVLLSGVNDCPNILERLSLDLMQLQVQPYYLHHPDPVVGNVGFRVSMARGLEICAELERRLGGIGLPGYVVDLPDGSGKVPVERYHRFRASIPQV